MFSAATAAAEAAADEFRTVHSDPPTRIIRKAIKASRGASEFQTGLLHRRDKRAHTVLLLLNSSGRK